MSRSLGLALVFVLAACRAEQGFQPGDDPDLATNSTDPQPDLADPNAAPPDLTGGGPVDPNGACEALSPRAEPVTVYALPDSGEAPYVDVLKSATTSIRISAYLMGYGGILDTLEEKCAASAGLDVKVLLDQGHTANDKYETILRDFGCTVKRSDPMWEHYHAKVIIADGARAVVSTGNYSKTYSVDKERNFVAHLNDPQDVADLVSIFDADWESQSLTMTCTRLLVSPINSKERLLDLIDSATTTLDIESMQLAETDIRKHVADRHEAGVTVRVLLAAPSWIDANQAAADYLQIQNIEPRWMSTPGVHVKAIIVDGERAYLGSQNFSWTSLTKNREVGLLIGGASEAASVKVMADTFEKDWATAKTFD